MSVKSILRKGLTYILIFNIVLTQWLQAIGPIHLDISREDLGGGHYGRLGLRINDKALDYHTATGVFREQILHEGASYDMSVKVIDARKNPHDASYQISLKKTGGGFDLQLRFSKEGLVDVDHAKTQDFFHISTFGSLHLANKTHHMAAALFTAKSIYNYGRCHVSQYLGLKRFEPFFEQAQQEEPLLRNAGDGRLSCQGKMDLFGGDFENQRAFTATDDLEIDLHGNRFIHKNTTHQLSRLTIVGKTRITRASEVLFHAPVEAEKSSVVIDATRFDADIKTLQRPDGSETGRPRGMVIGDLEVKAKEARISAQTHATLGRGSFYYQGKNTQDARESHVRVEGDLLCRESLSFVLGNVHVAHKARMAAKDLTVSGHHFENNGSVLTRTGYYILKNTFKNRGALGAKDSLCIDSHGALVNEGRGHLYGAHVSLASYFFSNSALIVGLEGNPIQDLVMTVWGAFLNTGHMEAKRVRGTFTPQREHTQPFVFHNQGRLVAQDKMILYGAGQGLNQGLMKSRDLTLEGTMVFCNDGPALSQMRDKTGVIEADATHFKLRGGAFNNKGVLETHRVDGFASKFRHFSNTPITTQWHLHASSFQNTGMLLGSGFIRVANIKNQGLFKGQLTLHVGSRGQNNGVLDLLCLVGEGHFYNHQKLTLASLDIRSFVNHGLVQADTLLIGRNNVSFQNMQDARVKIARLRSRSPDGEERVLINKGRAHIADADLLGKVVLESGSKWTGQSVTWTGSLFHLHGGSKISKMTSMAMYGKTLSDTSLNLEGATAHFNYLENNHKLKAQGGYFHADFLENKGEMTLENLRRVTLHALVNHKLMTLNETSLGARTFNNSGTFLSNADLDAKTVLNTGRVKAKNITVETSLENKKDGLSSARMDAERLVVQGQGTLPEHGYALVNEGSITASTGTFVGDVHLKEGSTLKTKTLHWTGRVFEILKNVTASFTQGSAFKGLVKNQTDLHFTSGRHSLTGLENTGRVDVTNRASVSFTTLGNKARFYAQDAGDITIEDLENEGSMDVKKATLFRVRKGKSSGRLSLEETQAYLGSGGLYVFDNAGEITIGKDAKVSLEDMDNEGVLKYAVASVVSHFFPAHRRGRKIGRIESEHLLTFERLGHNLSPLWQHLTAELLQAPLELQGHRLDLKDKVDYAFPLTLRADHVVNHADVKAKSLSVFARMTENHGRMGAVEDLTLQNVGALGKVYAGGTLTIDGSYREIVLAKDHLIESAKSVILKLGAALKNHQKLVIPELFSVTGATFFNFAHLKAGRILADLKGQFENGAQGAWGILESTLDDITLLAQNVHNRWGEIRSEKKITIRSQNNIINGARKTIRPSHGRGDFYRSNESLLFSKEGLVLEAVSGIENDFGTLFTLSDLVVQSPKTRNIAGLIYVRRNATLNGLFYNDRTVNRYPVHPNFYGEFPHHTPYKVFDIDPTTGDLGNLRALMRQSGHPFKGKHREITQDFLTSAPANFLVQGDLTLNPGGSFHNTASHLHVAGRSNLIGNGYYEHGIDLHMAAMSSEHHRGEGWKPIGTCFQTITPTFMSATSIALQLHILSVKGIISSPFIEGLVRGAMEISHGHRTTSGSSSSGVLTHLLPFMRAYEPQETLASQSSSSTSVVSLPATHGTSVVSIGRHASHKINDRDARHALLSLAGVRPHDEGSSSALVSLGVSSRQALTPLGRGALPDDVRRMSLPASHPGYLVGLRFLKECVDQRVNAAILCTNGLTSHALRGLFEDHMVINAAQPFLEEEWYREVLHSMNTGHLIGHMKTKHEIDLLKEVGLRFAMALGKTGILCVQDAEMDLSPFPMIFYKPVYRHGYYALFPHLYIPKNFWESSIFAARRDGVSGLYADQHITLRTGSTHISGMVASGEDCHLSCEGTTVIEAAAQNNLHNHGNTQTRAQNSGTVVSFRGATNVQADETVSLSGARIIAHKKASVEGKKGVMMESFGLTSCQTYGKKGDKTTITTTHQVPSQIVSQTDAVEVCAPQGAITGEGPELASPSLIQLSARDAIALGARRDTQEILHEEESGFIGFTDKSQTMTHTSTPQGAVFAAPCTHMRVAAHGGSIALESADMSQSNTITLEASRTQILSASKVTQIQYANASSNPFVNTMTVGGASHTDYVPPRFGAVPTFKAPLGEQTTPTVTLSVTNDALQDPILARIAALPNTIHETLRQESLTWERTTHRLGAGVMVALGICLSMISGGTGGSAMVAAIQAAETSLKLQFLDAFVAHGGNIGKAFGETFSGQGVRSAASAALTACLGHALQEASGASSTRGSLDFGKHLAHNVRLSASKIASQAVFEGKSAKDILKDGLLSIVSNTFASYATSHIGEGAHPRDGSAPHFDPFTHKALHAVVAAVSAKIVGKDMTAAAVGAVVGECVGEVCREELLKSAGHGGASNEEALELGVGLSGIAAAMVASFLDLDADTAANAASTAVRNNALFLIPLLIEAAPAIQAAYVALQLAGLGLIAYDVAEAYNRGGVEAAYKVLENNIQFHLATGGTGRVGLAAQQTLIRLKSICSSLKRGVSSVEGVLERISRSMGKRFTGTPGASTPKPANTNAPAASSTSGASSSGPSMPETPKVHKNSNKYVGETHVYVIRRADGTIEEIGESAQGVRLGDGASKRAEQQARRLQRKTGERFETEIRRTFKSKQEARDYEAKLIDRYRRMFGKDKLPGNKTNR